MLRAHRGATRVTFLAGHR